MVGIVLVSHSRPLASALVTLVGQMAAGERPPIAIAAGVGPDREELGTDAAEIAEAVQSVSDGSGVAVLMDLGSAILSAEMALDLLPEELRGQVRLVGAPFVEGAVAAAVQASLGSDLDTICSEAEQALQRKTEQLSPAGTTGAASATTTNEPPALAPAQAPTPGAPSEIILTLKNALGLHARPAAKFVKAAAGYQSEIKVRNVTTGKGPVNARSILGVISLAAVHGHQIALTAAGPDASQALEALRTLVEETLPGLPGE